jgi:excisionase family DNA binding protein
MMGTETELLWSVDEFCARTGLGRTKVYELFARGKVRPVRIGRRTLVPVAEARRWLEALCAESEAPRSAA